VFNIAQRRPCLPIRHGDQASQVGWRCRFPYGNPAAREARCCSGSRSFQRGAGPPFAGLDALPVGVVDCTGRAAPASSAFGPRVQQVATPVLDFEGRACVCAKPSSLGQREHERHQTTRNPRCRSSRAGLSARALSRPAGPTRSARARLPAVHGRRPKTRHVDPGANKGGPRRARSSADSRATTVQPRPTSPQHQLHEMEARVVTRCYEDGAGTAMARSSDGSRTARRGGGCHVPHIATRLGLGGRDRPPRVTPEDTRHSLLPPRATITCRANYLPEAVGASRGHAQSRRSRSTDFGLDRTYEASVRPFFFFVRA